MSAKFITKWIVEQEGILPRGNVPAGNGNIRQRTMESSHETQGAEVETTPDGWKGHLKTMISLGTYTFCCKQISTPWSFGCQTRKL